VVGIENCCYLGRVRDSSVGHGHGRRHGGRRQDVIWTGSNWHHHRYCVLWSLHQGAVTLLVVANKSRVHYWRRCVILQTFLSPLLVLADRPDVGLVVTVGALRRTCLVIGRGGRRGRLVRQ